MRGYLPRFGLFAALLLAGCASANEQIGIVRGLDSSIDTENLRKSTQAQNIIIEQLVSRSGLSGKPTLGHNDWAYILDAGIEFVDQECEGFVQALHRYDREQNALARGVSLVGTTASSIMGVAGSSAKALAVVASAFGLTSEGLSIARESVLYKIDPAAIRILISEAQAQYKAAVKTNRGVYTSRSAAMSGLQGYLALCLPATLESAVNTAVANSRFVTLNGSGTQPVLRQTSTDSSNLSPQQRKEKDLVLSPLAPDPQTPEEQRVNGCRAAECELKNEEVRAIQAALCVEADAGLKPRSGFGAETRSAIETYQTSTGKQNRSRILDETQITELQQIGPCANTVFLSAFERFTFGEARNRFTQIGETNKNRVTELKTRLKESIEANGLTLQDDFKNDANFDEPTRDAIAELKEFFAIQNQPRAITADLIAKLTE